MKRLVQALVASVVALAVTSCGKPGPGGVVDYTLDGSLPTAMIDPSTSTWESSAWAGPGVHWVPYGPHAQIRLEHDLGRVPAGVITYLSFTEDGTNPSQAAGDLARIVEVTDTHVTVWNDTNGAYYARVVLF